MHCFGEDDDDCAPPHARGAVGGPAHVEGVTELAAHEDLGDGVSILAGPDGAASTRTGR